MFPPFDRETTTVFIRALPRLAQCVHIRDRPRDDKHGAPASHPRSQSGDGQSEEPMAASSQPTEHVMCAVNVSLRTPGLIVISGKTGRDQQSVHSSPRPLGGWKRLRMMYPEAPNRGHCLTG